MKALLVVIAVVVLIAFTAMAGAYAIQEGINQAIAWREQQKEEKENQDNAEL